MGNFVNMEFLRLRKQKATFVILIALILMSVFYNYVIKIAIDTTVEMMEKEIKENGEVISELNIGDEKGEAIVSDFFTRQNMMIFILIFSAIFFTAPYQNGYIKNFIGLNENKSYYIFADFFIGIFYTLIVFIVTTITLIIGQKIFLNGYYQIEDSAKLLKIISLQLFPHFALVSVTLMLSTVNRKLSSVLVSSLLYFLMFYHLITKLLNFLLHHYAPVSDEWDLTDYTILGSMRAINLEAVQSDINRAVIVSIVIIIISLMISALVIRKKDI